MLTEPRATYRVQFRPDFGLDEAAGLVNYLADLGVSHLYCSPYLQAAPGSTHGYDVVNYHQVNKELGGAEAQIRLREALSGRRLGQVLDLVPNHMAITGRENPWWWDVLENGPASRYASYFDIEWSPPDSRGDNRVILPILGDQYGRTLEAGELQLEYHNGYFTVHYADHVFPVSPRTIDQLLAAAAEQSSARAQRASAWDELAFLSDAFSRLPPAWTTDYDRVRRRHRDKEVLIRYLARLCAQEPEIEAAVRSVVSEVNADPDRLDALIQRQNYRLAFWQIARQDLGYRRFFDINSLAGLRMEDEQVFNDTHALVLDWLTDGQKDGLRIDHPDGLRDPKAYFERLRQHLPDAWIVVEKILEPGEPLRPSWPVAGTTGYDFLNRTNGLFVDPAGEGVLTEFYADFTGESTDYPALGWEKKHLVMDQILGSDVNHLTDLFLQVREGHRRHRDYSREALQAALCEVAACFPVYRTYVEAGAEPSSDDVRYVSEAIEAARAHRADLDGELFDFLQDLLLLRHHGAVEIELAMRFQQFTGPVMAKGIEDTALYCFNRLVSLNEVGGNPDQFGISVETFHQSCNETLQHWPQTMLTTSTHDTKRSEDVRARLNLLSEIPREWAEAVRDWSAHNERHRTEEWPDRNAEYLLYQTLVGAWPIEQERVLQYMEKAIREAKVHTSWTAPNQAYEEAVANFVKGLLADDAFVARLETFVSRLIEPGRINSLSQTLLKLTAPGVPDLYQGSELWNLSLADPDNRRPVDFNLRRRLLAEMEGLSPEQIMARIDEGLPKLWVVRQALALRNRRPALFGPDGEYRPLEVRGRRARHLVAFVRGDGSITAVPRLVLGLGGDWAGTTVALPPGPWHHEFTGETFTGEVEVAELLARFPVCLLSS